MEERQFTPQQEGNPEQGMPPQMPQEETHRAPMGPIIGVIIVVAVLAIGGLYYWGAQLNEQQDFLMEEEMEDGDMANDAPTPEELRAQSDSDELEAIEADLEASNFNQLDAELAEIESELSY